MTIDWGMVTAIATILGGIAVVGSLWLVVVQLREQAKEEFVSGTANLFDVWVDDDFQRAVQWVLYDLSERTWKEFVVKHRKQYGERALIRVGAYFNRIGYLVTHNLLGNEEKLLLDTVAGSAIAVWQQIEPLILEARLVENSTLFSDFQHMLPECYECYVPTQPVPTLIREEAEAAARLSGE